MLMLSFSLYLRRNPGNNHRSQISPDLKIVLLFRQAVTLFRMFLLTDVFFISQRLQQKYSFMFLLSIPFIVNLCLFYALMFCFWGKSSALSLKSKSTITFRWILSMSLLIGYLCLIDFTRWMRIFVDEYLGLISFNQGKFLHPASHLSTINQNCPYKTLRFIDAYDD